MWQTFQLFFPNVFEDLKNDCAWLLAGAFSWDWIVTWTAAKLLWFLIACVAYLYAFYRLALFVLSFIS
jgi:hypothetical protein